MGNEEMDLGSGFYCRYVGWAPDREVNPQYAGRPDVKRWGLIIVCPHGEGMVTFDGPTQQALSPDQPKWTVESWEPLTLSPSVLRTECGCHGFVQSGKWVPT